MVKRPYRIANSRQYKEEPKTLGSNKAHNARKVKELKTKSKRGNRRSVNYNLKTMTEAINDGRIQYYLKERERNVNGTVKPVRRLYNPSDGHLFSLRDSWPNSGQDGE